MENLDLVYQKTSNPQSPTHSRPAKRGSRQAIQTRPYHPNGVVSPSRGLPNNIQQVAPAPNRPICHKVQQQVASVSPDPLVSGVDTLSLPWEDLDAYAFPPAAILGKVVEKLQDSPCKRIILIVLGWPNMPWFWDLVAMSSQIPLSLPILPNLLTQPFNQIPHRNRTNLNLRTWLLDPSVSAQPAQSGISTIQPDLAQELVKPESTCLAPRATAIKEQGFSEAVAARIEARQRGSTRSVYEAKSTIFTKWCLCNQVDFRAPPVKSAADFLLYLF